MQSDLLSRFGTPNHGLRLEKATMVACLVLMPGGLMWAWLWPNTSGPWLQAMLCVAVLVRLARGLRGIEKEAAVGIGVGFGALIAPSAIAFELLVGVSLLLVRPRGRLGPLLWMASGAGIAVLLQPKPQVHVEFLFPSLSALPVIGLLLLIAACCGNRVRPLVIVWLAAMSACLSVPECTLIALPALVLVAACNDTPRPAESPRGALISLPALLTATLALAPSIVPSDQLPLRVPAPMDKERRAALMSDLPPSLVPANLPDPALRHARAAVQLALLAHTDAGKAALPRITKGIDTYRMAARQQGLSPAAASLMDVIIAVSLNAAHGAEP